jgi:hypothetical protein
LGDEYRKKALKRENVWAFIGYMPPLLAGPQFLPSVQLETSAAKIASGRFISFGWCIVCISTVMKTYWGASLLVLFYATMLSAAEVPGNLVGNDASFPRIETGKAASRESTAGLTNEYLKGHTADYKGDVTASTFGNLSSKAASDCLNKNCKETVMVPLYSSSKENSWSLASLHDGFSLNLQDVMRNLGVILQHRF